jgi:hypothetical protein
MEKCKWRIKKNGGRGEIKYDIFEIRTFVNATMYPKYCLSLKFLLYNENKIFD